MIESRRGTASTAEAIENPGWMLWPLIPYSYNTINYGVPPRPRRPTANHWLGTDDQTRDVLARVIYGFRLSVLFALIVTVISPRVIGIVAGAVQGYFGGWTIDLFFQRFIEIWVEPRRSTSSSSSSRSSREVSGC
jgi:microcin C transport system permease protein